jgi:hypothetical protein
MKTSIRTHALAFFLTLPAVCGADTPAPVPAHWIRLGNEMEDAVAEGTGRPVRYLTAGHAVETHFHYHNTSWGTVLGREYLFIESCRERPPAAGTGRPGERQILAADTTGGDLYYITTIPNERPTPNTITQWASRQYRCEFFAPWNELLFFDKALRKIRAHNVLDGKQRLLLELPPGATSRGFTAAPLADGGIRLAYSYSISAGGAGGQIRDVIAYSDFDRDFKLRETRVAFESAPGEAYDHVDMRRGDPDCIFYYHHADPIKGKGRDGFARHLLHVVSLKNPAGTDLVVNPDNSTADHHTWGASGKHMYWDNNRGTMYRYDVDARKLEIVGKSGCIHNKLSPDETLWAYDIRAQLPHETLKGDNGAKIENWWGEMFIYNLVTRRHDKLADIVWADPHPRHPHTHFSPDGTRLSFVTGVNGSVNTRVAVMRVRD